MTVVAKLKQSVRHLIPQKIVNNILLALPFLYRNRLINYETNLENGIPELLAQLASTFDLEGDIIECGSSFCGTSAIMAKYLVDNHVEKKIFACDSFEGFDRNELAKEVDAGLVNVKENAFTFTSYNYIVRKIAKLGLKDTIVPVKGFFEATLPHITGKLSFALIDCDLRDSIVYCMERVFPQLSNGGRILIDDYSHSDWRGAKLGVDHFVSQHQEEIAQHRLLDRFYLVQKK
jgi:O-methyltransferase